MPFQQMPDTVPADAGYRSSRCRIPFQQIRYPQAEQAANPRQCWVSAFGENEPNPVLLLF